MSPNEHGNWCSSYSGGILLRQKAYPTQLFHHCTFTQTIMKGEPHTPPRVISWWSHEEPRCPHAIVAPLLRLDSIHGRLYTMWLYKMGLNEQSTLQHIHIACILHYQVMKKEISFQVSVGYMSLYIHEQNQTTCSSCP